MINKDTAVECYLSGLTLEETGARLGCTREYIRLIMAERGIERRHQGRRPAPPIPAATISAITRAYLDGESSIEALVKEHGHSRTSIREAIINAGIVIENRGPTEGARRRRGFRGNKLDPERVRQIRAELAIPWRQRGRPWKLIAAAHGVSIGMIAHIRTGRAWGWVA